MVHQCGAPTFGALRWLAALVAVTLVPCAEAGLLQVKDQAVLRQAKARKSGLRLRPLEAWPHDSIHHDSLSMLQANNVGQVQTRDASPAPAPALVASGSPGPAAIVPCPAGINGSMAEAAGCTPTLPPTTTTPPPPTTTLFQGTEVRIVVAGLPLGVTNEPSVKRIASDIEFQVANADWRGSYMHDFFAKYGANQSQQLPPPEVSMNIEPLPPPIAPPTEPPTTTPKPGTTLRITTKPPPGGHPTTKASDHLLKLTTTTVAPATPPPADDAPPPMMQNMALPKDSYDTESPPEEAVEKTDENGNKLLCADGQCTNEAGEIVPDSSAK
eukprot:gnl/TRDRNA2_/TRDRNA2_182043_c0_seq1.p1 gnl/TRDRNA2_/TRDRNA2_182043_c0~~gnl/TRDRNA2_/TRDRNA2_182043_c0_seq1.p1  ORF type:complete len:327 (+),score=59.30 gnl/TRDRNA2_/TRDRNA2_182043_c0_seq1:64-1044(+)